MNYIYLFIIWLILNVLTGITMDLALFTQTTPSMKDATIYMKILASEFWASIQWLFVITANRLGNLLLNPAQIGLSSYIFDFLSQILSNMFWLNLTTSIDDYIGMVFIFIGMYISTMRTFG